LLNSDLSTRTGDGTSICQNCKHHGHVCEFPPRGRRRKLSGNVPNRSGQSHNPGETSAPAGFLDTTGNGSFRDQGHNSTFRDEVASHGHYGGFDGRRGSLIPSSEMGNGVPPVAAKPPAGRGHQLSTSSLQLPETRPVHHASEDARGIINHSETTRHIESPKNDGQIAQRSEGRSAVAEPDATPRIRRPIGAKGGIDQSLGRPQYRGPRTESDDESEGARSPDVDCFHWNCNVCTARSPKGPTDIPLRLMWIIMVRCSARTFPGWVMVYKFVANPVLGQELDLFSQRVVNLLFAGSPTRQARQTTQRWLVLFLTMRGFD
jgi:hypothetical protein